VRKERCERERDGGNRKDEERGRRREREEKRGMEKRRMWIKQLQFMPVQCRAEHTNIKASTKDIIITPDIQTHRPSYKHSQIMQQRETDRQDL